MSASVLRWSATAPAACSAQATAAGLLTSAAGKGIDARHMVSTTYALCRLGSSQSIILLDSPLRPVAQAVEHGVA